MPAIAAADVVLACRMSDLSVSRNAARSAGGAVAQEDPPHPTATQQARGQHHC